MKINNRSIMLVAASAGSLLAAGGWLHCRMVADRGEHLDQLQTEASALRVQLRNDEFQQQVAQLRQQADQQPTVLPREDDVVQLLQQLACDLNDLRIADRSFATGASSRMDSMQRIPLSLSFKGSFATVFELLSRLQRYQRIVRVERLVVSRDSPDGDSLLVSARFNAFVHVNPEAP